jgi:hypothetical protein
MALLASASLFLRLHRENTNGSPKIPVGSYAPWPDSTSTSLDFAFPRWSVRHVENEWHP